MYMFKLTALIYMLRTNLPFIISKIANGDVDLNKGSLALETGLIDVIRKNFVSSKLKFMEIQFLVLVRLFPCER